MLFQLASHPQIMMMIMIMIMMMMLILMLMTMMTTMMVMTNAFPAGFSSSNYDGADADYGDDDPFTIIML